MECRLQGAEVVSKGASVDPVGKGGRFGLMMTGVDKVGRPTNLQPRFAPTGERFRLENFGWGKHADEMISELQSDHYPSGV